MAIVNIAGVDFSGNVKVGTYKVNSEDVYSGWTDANGIEHRHITRQRVSGTFEMQFRNMAQFKEFTEHIESNTTKDGYVPCHIFVNNLAKRKSCNMYISYKPSLTRQCNSRDYVDLFSVEVSER